MLEQCDVALQLTSRCYLRHAIRCQLTHATTETAYLLGRHLLCRLQFASAEGRRSDGQHCETLRS